LNVAPYGGVEYGSKPPLKIILAKMPVSSTSPQSAMLAAIPQDRLLFSTQPQFYSAITDKLFDQEH